MRETKTCQQAAQLHECYMITMMMMMMMLRMNDRNELLELQSNVKFQTAKQARGKQVSSRTNYPVCSKERVYLRTFSFLNGSITMFL